MKGEIVEEKEREDEDQREKKEEGLFCSQQKTFSYHIFLREGVRVGRARDIKS